MEQNLLNTHILPVILMLDNSGSMDGQKNISLNLTVSEMIRNFSKDAPSNIDVYVSVITLGEKASLHTSFTASKDFTFDGVTCGGNAYFSRAVDLAISTLVYSNIMTKTALSPIIILVSDGFLNEELRNNAIAQFQRLSIGIGIELDSNALSTFASKESNVFLPQDSSDIIKFFELQQFNDFNLDNIQ